jgi:squalene cyclase
MKMSGYNGSQLWDTAFTAQAYVAAGVRTEECKESLKRAHEYIKNTQVRLPIASSCSMHEYHAGRQTQG